MTQHPNSRQRQGDIDRKDVDEASCLEVEWIRVATSTDFARDEDDEQAQFVECVVFRACGLTRPCKIRSIGLMGQDEV